MESSEHISDETLEKKDSKNKYKYIGEAIILGGSGISAIIAGLVTSYVAKKRNKEYFQEIGEKLPPAMLENPYSLAFKAFAWGTVWAVGGFSLIMFGIWKFYGIKNLEDFKMVMKSNIKKSPPTNERTEFENLSDFINYLKETPEKKKDT